MTESEEDAQRRAFTEAGPYDWAGTDLLEVEAVHAPGDPDAPPIRTPEEWDAAGWDADREGPKSLAEARAALAARIDDPAAPDPLAHLGAYNNLSYADEVDD
jgi:hypothetical protein